MLNAGLVVLRDTWLVPIPSSKELLGKLQIWVAKGGHEAKNEPLPLEPPVGSMNSFGDRENQKHGHMVALPLTGLKHHQA